MNLKLKMAILKRFPCQADFAQVVGMGETVLSRIIKGRRFPTAVQKQIMAEKLGVPETELFPQK